MALTLPKLALPKLTLTKRQILTVAGGVVLAAAAGWLGWQYFEDTGPAPAAVTKPQPVTAAKQPAAGKAAAPADAGAAQDKLIEEVLIASGLKQQLSQLPQQLIAGVRHLGKQRSKTSPALAKTIENAVAEAFTAQGFQDRVRADLKKNFDQKRLPALLADLSTPAAKRMVALEQVSPSPEELVQFARSPAATRPSPQRTSLIKRIDAAAKAGDLAVDAAFASMKAVASGIVGGDAGAAAAVDKTIEKQRASATADIRNATLRNLAFGYRDASDADLEAYAKIYEGENGKWFSGIVYAAILEEIKSASARAGERIGAQATKPAAPQRTAAEHAATGSKARADATTCLGLATNAEIIKCAQQYR